MKANLQSTTVIVFRICRVVLVTQKRCLRFVSFLWQSKYQQSRKACEDLTSHLTSVKCEVKDPIVFVFAFGK